MYAGEAPGQSTLAAASGINRWLSRHGGLDHGISQMFKLELPSSRRGEPAPKKKPPVSRGFPVLKSLCIRKPQTSCEGAGVYPQPSPDHCTPYRTVCTDTVGKRSPVRHDSRGRMCRLYTRAPSEKQSAAILADITLYRVALATGERK